MKATNKKQNEIKFNVYRYARNKSSKYVSFLDFKQFILCEYDMRTRHAKSLVKELGNWSNFNFQSEINDIRRKRRERNENKQYKHTNIITNKIVIDYFENKNSITYFDSSNRYICFGGRKHWAKNDFDKKVIAILHKHFVESGQQARIRKANDQHFELHKQILFELEAKKRY
jgi:hypothetical protein